MVAGAGLVGSLLAIFLARRGKAVEVFERRPDMRREQISAGRSINLAISVRGPARAGAGGAGAGGAGPRHPHARADDRTRATAALAFQAYGKDDSQCIHSISRGLLNRMLLDAAERTGRVRLSFRRRVRRPGLRATRARGRGRRRCTPSASSGAVVYGTDGAGSAVRRAVVEARGGVPRRRRSLAHGYKELTLPAAPDGSWRLERNALHIWPRGDFMLIALPNEDGSFTCTLFLAFEGAPSFADPGRARARSGRSSASTSPTWSRCFPTSRSQFAGNPTGLDGHREVFGLARWRTRALLLGDAAHAIVPFFGQGMNCGFEDCVVLDGLEAAGAPRARRCSPGSRRCGSRTPTPSPTWRWRTSSRCAPAPPTRASSWRRPSRSDLLAELPGRVRLAGTRW